MAPPPSSNVATKSLTPATHPMMREVTEDTPADLLLGTMDLVVVLPNKSSVRMTVNRRTPMMDLLIQVTTANKINPGGHIVLVRNERGIELRYKPSTPIGALDTTTLEIVPKNQVNEYMIVKKPPVNKPANQPFEQTFRLQVHLPRQQLYVMRVGYKTILQDILDEVCQEKNLDIAKYELRHPLNLDEKLILSNSLGDYGLQQVTVVSKSSKSHSVSTADIMAIQQNEGGTKAYLDSAFKYSRSSVGDSSASSESAGSGCGVSRSDDDSRSVSPLPPPVPRAKVKLNTTVSNASSSSEASSTALKSAQPTRMDGLKPKKRAPAPPGITGSAPGSETARKGDAPRVLTKHESLPAQNHSRHSSDSSGYHDSSPSILSDNFDQKRNQRPLSIQHVPSTNGSSSLNKSSATSLTNLTSVSSLSSTSLASSNGGVRNKRKAPKPPPGTPGGSTLQAQTELEEELTTDSEVAGASAQSSEQLAAKKNSNNSDSPQDVKDTETESKVDEFVVQTRKPLTQRSSSSMSSLSSPTSPPHSTASSPLPIDLPPTQKTKSTGPVPEAALVAAEIDNARASSRNSQAASSLPKPPPRTARTVKPRDTSPQTSEPQPQESGSNQPKPKPRPDRKNNDNDAGDGKPVPAELKNPLTRFGVKVLPNNALQERAARFPAINASNSVSDGEHELPASKTVFKGNDRSDKSTPYKQKSKERLSSPTNTSHELPLAQKLQKFGSHESSHSPDEDSDNLEENLELFEVKRQEPSHNRREMEIHADKTSARQTAATSYKNESFDNENDDLQASGEERLNRWKNFESLDKVTIEDAKLKTPKRANATTKSNQTTSHLDFSSDNEDSEGPLEEANDQASSSESEVSYSASADSGIPTTANATPTPMSLERLESDQSKLNEENNLKSSTQVSSPTSDASANWSEILQSKAKDQEANMEKELQTANFKVDNVEYSVANDAQGQEIESNFEFVRQSPSKNEREAAEEESDKEEHEIQSKDEEVKILDVQLKKENTLESFSNENVNVNSENDTKLKRKVYAESSTSSSKHQTSNLNSKLHLSNSEEDLRKSESAQRFTSMQNLSSRESDNNTKERNKLQAIEGRKKENELTQKSTGTTDLEQEITQDPNLMQAFQVELEAQFEEWKKQFLEKHTIEKSKSESKDSQPSLDEQEQVPAEDPPANNETGSSVSPVPNNSEQDKNLQPEKPQADERSSTDASSSELERQTFEHAKQLTSERSQIETPQKTAVASQSSTEVEYNRTESSERSTGEMYAAANGQATQNGKDIQFYKYSGPPAIQMATWSERPRANIAVKNDSDYKMGMGQNDTKNASEFRPKLGSAATRMHSFNGGPVASPMLNKSASLTRGNSAVPNVVANWQQSLQTSEEERKSATLEKLIQIKENNSEPTSFEEDKVTRKSASVTSSLERPAKSKTNFSISSASSTLERPAKKLNAPAVYGLRTPQNGEHSSSNGVQTNNTSSTANAVSAWVNKSENSKSIELKEEPKRTVERKPSNNVTTVILNSNESSTHSSPSLREKKAFFQGIAPVESPTKEVPPSPSVNMKSSIATIQKVFEQKRDKSSAETPAKEKEQSVKEHSPALSVSSSFSSRSSSSNLSTPELIGGTGQSTLMVQKVLKANSFNAFMRTSSPSSSRSTGSSPRSTPSPTVIDTSSNKIYQSAAPTSSVLPNKDSSYYNNKAVIIIGGEDTSTNKNNNVYKQKLKVQGMLKESAPTSSPAKQNVEKVNVNGEVAGTQVITVNQTEKSPFGITLKSKNQNQTDSKSLPAQKSIEISEGELSKRNVGPMKLAGYTPSPPPPPPAPAMPVEKPTTLAVGPADKKGKSSFASPSSNPTSPMSPDPRADIFNEIKNSGGNFKLKKTGSAALLR